ncbi:MAG: putative lipid II flippase FtsW [Candidatus Nomurabacteria bacterium]|nr:putative lipid II flippase FtsW [Candidatus Nomurabacteria bacterium]
MKKQKIDRFFLGIIIALILVGIAMFISASLGLLMRNQHTFYSVLISQLVFGLGLGGLGIFFCLKVPIKFWRKNAFYIFLGSIILTAMVFVPHLGFVHGGARRWISILGFSFQPSEILKFSFVIYFSAWLSWAKNKVQDFKFGILPLGVMLAIIAGILLKQPDTKSFILITITGITMLFISGVPWKYIIGIGLASVLLLGGLVIFTPYLRARVNTFIHPSQDSQGSSYQLQQSLIAIGSGGVFGRGYGQSIQKFSYLPEPQGDSIFAVVGEELGFVGSVSIIFLYVLFAFRGLRIANRSPDLFGRLLVSGIVILITAQSFMNIASIIGVFPLTGVPLVFMSQGGTSFMIDLIAIGIVLQVSKLQRENNN